MPHRNPWDQLALDSLIAPGRSVALHAELREVGLSTATITRRIGPRGPWQRLLPGVVAGHRGSSTTHEQNLAALKYSGPSSVLTGMAALAQHGVRTARGRRRDRVHVLVDHSCRRTSHGFALLTRTRYLPQVIERNGLRCAPVARALVDACRWLTELDVVRELVAEVIQEGRCTLTELRDAVRFAARQRTALTREVLREMDAGVRSAAEAKLRVEFLRNGVPAPSWNADLLTPDGEFVATPDALWEQVMGVLELDSMAWHLSPSSYRRTQRRQALLARHNVSVLPISPADALADPEATCSQVKEFLVALSGRALPNLLVRRRAAA